MRTARMNADPGSHLTGLLPAEAIFPLAFRSCSRVSPGTQDVDVRVSPGTQDVDMDVSPGTQDVDVDVSPT